MTSMMTEMEILELEQLEATRPCTPWTQDCGVEAAWLFTALCCGIEVPLCGGHKLLVIEQLNRLRFLVPICLSCGADLAPDPFDHCRIEAL